MRFSRSDAAVSAALLLGAVAFLGLFIADLNAVASRVGEKRLGTVVFKKLVATRKSSSGFGWEQMRTDGPVFNADTLRTGDFAAATVFFDDGTSLDMLEDSMLKLDFGGKTKNVEFLSGRIGVGSSKESTSYTISSTAGRITVDKGAKATFSRDAGKLSVEVNRGGASLVKADGSTQAIAANQELQVDVESGKASLVIRPILPLSPEPDARLLSFAGGEKAPIDFAWQSGAAQGGDETVPEGATYTLEVSPSANFDAGELTTLKTSGFSTRASLGAGGWYWRVRDSGGEVSPVRRFSLDLAIASGPIFPSDGQHYEYRGVKPRVSFAWTEVPEASAYYFEIAADSGFSKPILRSRTATTNLAMDSLGEGTWYWRVSPIHAYTVLGQAPVAATCSFVIAKKAAMAPLALTAPYEGSLYQVQEIGGKGLDFAWAPESEAASYELIVSRNRDLSSPLLEIASTQPYLSLSGDRAGALARPGAYYWGVRWKDGEGLSSPPSSARQLQGVDGSVAIRLSFPPDGYRVADSLVHDTRFAWKSNVNARTVFQLSRDADFRDLAYEERVSADTLIGREWEKGTYYWRLRSYNADGSVFMEVPARSFEVVEPFAPPSLLYPGPGSRLFLREGDAVTFSWAPTKGADYYSLILRSAGDDRAPALLEKTFLEGSSLTYPLGGLADGNYRISIQAFAASGEKTTRIIGYIGDNEFTYKRLSYIKLADPPDGSHVPGLDARAGKEVFVSDIEDQPDESELVVATDPAMSNVVARAPARLGRASVVGLKPGLYFWTVRGRLAGLDVSSKERFRLEVDPVPPPQATTALAPLEGMLYRVEDVVGKGLDLSWAPVPTAVSYQLVVSRSKDLSSPLLKLDSTHATAKLSGPMAASLARPGSYYWGLRWSNAYGDLSLPSSVRRFQVVEARDAISLSSPPDGYRIADSRVAGTRFAWESRIDAPTLFQLSRDPEFRSIEYQEEAKEGSLSGHAWESGRHYWRLLVPNADGSPLVESPARTFEIVEPLAGPILRSPAPGDTLLLREGDTASLSWTPVNGADYYKVILRSVSEGRAETLLEKDSVRDSSLTLALGDLPSGDYRLSIQAFIAAGNLTTEIVGDIGESDFTEKRLSFIKLERPGDGEHIAGLDVLRGGKIFSYRLAERPDVAELEVSTDPAGENVVARGFDRSGRASVGRLAPGLYYWTVRGSFSGLDISARSRFRFSVDPIPLLPPPVPSSPSPNEIIGPAQLRQNRSILFSWKPVAGANRYIISLYAQGRSVPIFTRDDIPTTSYTFEDLPLLDKGDFAWTVEARSYAADGEIEQRGGESPSAFAIKLPPLGEATIDEGGEALYGF